MEKLELILEEIKTSEHTGVVWEIRDYKIYEYVVTVVNTIKDGVKRIEHIGVSRDNMNTPEIKVVNKDVITSKDYASNVKLKVGYMNFYADIHSIDYVIEKMIEAKNVIEIITKEFLIDEEGCENE